MEVVALAEGLPVEEEVMEEEVMIGAAMALLEAAIVEVTVVDQEDTHRTEMTLTTCTWVTRHGRSRR